MSVIQIYGLVCLILMCVSLVVALTVFRRWYSWERLWKGTLRLTIGMFIGACAIFVAVLILAVIPVFVEYIEGITFSQSYVSLVGDSPWGANMGIVVILVLVLGSAFWGIISLSDNIIPYSDKEKGLSAGETEWWNSKVPKVFQVRSKPS